MRASLVAACTLTALTVVSAGGLAAGHPLDTRHIDHRTTAKLSFEPAWNSFLAATPEGTARAFLADRAGRDGIPADISGLVLVRQKESLLAHHFTFQQMLYDVPVFGGEFIVSVAKRDGRVMRTYNNLYPVGENAAFLPRSGIDQEFAFDRAWEHLRASGDLRSVPEARLVYTPEGESFRLNWLVDIDIDGPDGAWRVRVDAQSGQVVEVTDRRVTRKAQAPVAERLAQHDGIVIDRRAAFARARARAAEQAARLNNPNASLVSGTGVVFDPDPRTTLQNNSLQDTSPAGAFTNAYFTRPLEDIEYSSGLYRLDGPWVYILDWDSPHTPPSTTTDGHWTSTRGPNSFNDAMTYFQLDQSQRYIQSLGFAGASGIQYGSIGADTDGFGGADNSAYYPGTNRLTYGHGCVDDDEDADVILHEYGHAINHDINPSWGGGDMGAMGEGWGDYWGGSYSYSTPGGDTFYPDWIYTWDGHGSPVQCWPGRIMNAWGARYIHTQYYGAHQSIPGGYQSDELWSTPIFQSLRQLVEEYGETRESVDTILLESQFGLGSGLKMRDMAHVIIATAEELEPGGPHAAVFIERFEWHDIILPAVPELAIEAFEVVAEPSGNGAPDPGETVDVQVTLNNTGLGAATEVSAVLTTETPDITVVQGAADFPDLPIDGSGTGSVAYTFAVGSGVECGTLIEFSLEISYLESGNPESVVLMPQMRVGVPAGDFGTASPNAPLPDDDGTEVISSIVFSGTGAVVSPELNVDVNITHSYIGDLVVRLISPEGTSAILHGYNGGAAHDLIGNYPNTLTPVMSLDRFFGEPLDGEWQLRVRDGGSGGTGTFNSWALYNSYEFDCDLTTTDTPESPIATRFLLNQNVPNPFNPATEIAFSVPAEGGLVTLEIFDVRGFKVRTLERSDLAPGSYTRTWNGLDDTGARVSSGTYFYRLTGNGFAQTRKMVIVQ